MIPNIIRVTPEQFVRTFADAYREAGLPTDGIDAKTLASLDGDLGHGFYYRPMMNVSEAAGVYWHEGGQRGGRECETAWAAPHLPIRILHLDWQKFSPDLDDHPGGVFVICLSTATKEEIDAATEPEVFRWSND
jgi:hypothetical protein